MPRGWLFICMLLSLSITSTPTIHKSKHSQPLDSANWPACLAGKFKRIWNVIHVQICAHAYISVCVCACVISSNGQLGRFLPEGRETKWKNLSDLAQASVHVRACVWLELKCGVNFKCFIYISIYISYIHIYISISRGLVNTR